MTAALKLDGGLKPSQVVNADPSCQPEVFSLSVVVPVYNSAASLSSLLHRLTPVLESVALEYEVILVNDGSRDLSWQVIKELHQQFPSIRGVNLMRNYGQHGALLAGIRMARHQLIVTIDDDLQNPPEEIPKLISELTLGYDVVYGKPRKEQHGLLRDLASTLTKMGLQSAMGVEAARNVSAFRVFRRELRNAFRHYDGPFVSIDVLLTWGTTRFSSVTVLHDVRQVGASNYTFGKLVNHAINLITGFSTLPLRVATFVGFAFTLFGLGILGFVILQFLMNKDSVPGFPFLASIISIFSGSQLFAMGIIGEYLARMHFRSMGLPSSVVREQVGMEL
jgi:glycosyltransferase involved in cell wall biosynthesis